jgi:hypothetical protein
MFEEIGRLVLGVDEDPDNVELWERLLSCLKRRGSLGPIAWFAQQELGRVRHRIWLTTTDEGRAIQAFEPLTSMGYVLDIVPCGRVIHIGRNWRRGAEGAYYEYLRESAYPDPSWRLGSVEYLCRDAECRQEYFEDTNQWGWTEREKPLSGHEKPICKSCLKALRSSFRGKYDEDEGEKPLTSEQVDAIEALNKR